MHSRIRQNSCAIYFCVVTIPSFSEKRMWDFRDKLHWRDRDAPMPRSLFCAKEFLKLERSQESGISAANDWHTKNYQVKPLCSLACVSPSLGVGNPSWPFPLFTHDVENMKWASGSRIQWIFGIPIFSTCSLASSNSLSVVLSVSNVTIIFSVIGV